MLLTFVSEDGSKVGGHCYLVHFYHIAGERPGCPISERYKPVREFSIALGVDCSGLSSSTESFNLLKMSKSEEAHVTPSDDGDHFGVMLRPPFWLDCVALATRQSMRVPWPISPRSEPAKLAVIW